MRSQRPQFGAATTLTRSSGRPASESPRDPAGTLPSPVSLLVSGPRRPKRHWPRLKSLATAAPLATLQVHASEQVQDCVAKNTFRDRARRDRKPGELMQSAALWWRSTGSYDFAEQLDGGRADWLKTQRQSHSPCLSAPSCQRNEESCKSCCHRDLRFPSLEMNVATKEQCSQIDSKASIKTQSPPAGTWRPDPCNRDAVLPNSAASATSNRDRRD